VAFYTAYTKSATFRAGVNRLWSDLKTGAQDAVNFVIGKINDLLTAYNKVSGFLGKITGGAVGGGHLDLLGTATFANPVTKAPKPTTAKQRTVGSIVSHSPDLASLLAGTKTLGFQPVKGHRASGGMITDPGVYEVGERGPERVHLPAGSGVEPNGGWGDTVVHNHIHLDSKEVAQSVLRVSTAAKAVR
jgi:hypothetical protein